MTKARGYLYFHTSDHDGFHRRITGDRYDKAAGAPRVPLNAVFVLLSVDRRNNTAAQLRLLQTPIKNVVRLTTLAEFTADPFGAHYITPLEYEECLRGTPYDILEQTPSRSSARDGLVESRIRKHRLVV